MAAARSLPTATLHEAGGKIGALPSAIKPVAPGFRLCGPALTVHAPAGDNLWLHRAFELAQPGDVMVVYASGVAEIGFPVFARSLCIRGTSDHAVAVAVAVAGHQITRLHGDVADAHRRVDPADGAEILRATAQDHQDARALPQ